MADSQQTPVAPPPMREVDYAPGRPDESLAFNESITTETAHAGMPQLTPPEETVATGAEEGISVWLTNKKILRLWTNSANKNSWIAISGVGWRRLYNAHEGTTVCMTMLAAHARAENRNVNVRIEADNLVHEIYVW